MRKRRGRAGGVSVGTVAALILTGLVIAGCVALFPKLMGSVDERVDAQRVSVAIDDSLRSLRGETAAPGTETPETTPATAPPLEIAVYETPTPTASPDVTHTLSLTAAGAVAIDTTIQKTCTGSQGYAFAPVFAQLTGLFTSDLNLASLNNLAVTGEKLSDINMPSDALSALRDAGLNVLCTGFPGALNLGVSGLARTLDAVSGAGMTPYGTYVSAEARNHVTTVQVRDTMVAFLSFQNELTSASKKNTSKEEQEYVIAPLTLPTVAAEITAARAAGAQIVVVSLCWGKEGATSPSDSQRELAQGIANAGADIILGTNSSALQTVELLNATRTDGTLHQTLCAYSLGCLLNSNRSNRDSVSAALMNVKMTYNLSQDTLTFDSLTYVPLYIWRQKLDGATAYRLVRSNGDVPDAMNKDQQGVMSRSLTLVRDRFADSPLTEALP